MIYLDYNATAPLLPAVKDAMDEISGRPLNPSSIHASGRFARKIVEEARIKILKSVNAKNLVFTSSASEANNQVSVFTFQDSGFFISAIEHESIFRAAKNPIIINVQENGVIDLQDFEQKLSRYPNPKSQMLISIMLANNETGIIQPIKEAVSIARDFGAIIHTDAVQAYGRVEIDFEDLDVDLMTISSHKAGGPVGAAALIYKDGIELNPFIKGGGQEKNKRAGTENVTAIHGLGVFASGHQMQDAGYQNYLETELKKLGCVIVGENQKRLPNTTCMIHPNLPAATQLIHLDSSGICVSSGSACSSGKVEISRILQMLKVTNAQNAIRVSTGWNTTKQEVEKMVDSLKQLNK